MGKVNWTMTCFSSSPRYLINFLVRCVLGAVFLYAGIGKIIHPEVFGQAIYRYQLLPDLLVSLTAIILPWVELALGLLLIFGLWIPGTVFLCNVLLAVFLGLLVVTIMRGMDIDCGCFVVSREPESQTSLWWEVLRDAVFQGLAIYLFFQTKGGRRKPAGRTTAAV